MPPIRIEGLDEDVQGRAARGRPRRPGDRDGEFMVLVGPSGCGKSTLLQMLAGIVEVTAGTIHIGDQDVTRLDPRKRDIAMVFQSYALYPHLSVRGNLGFGLKLRGTSKADIARRVEDVARILGLEEVLDRKPGELSGGQRQRVAMGRAIVREPRAFLMDEPLSNLDAKLRVSMRVAARRLHERLGVTTVYVTHDQVEAMTLGDRVAVLRRGVLQQCDTPQALFATPANLFVAAFIGSPAMNLVEATVEGGEARFGACRIALPAGSRLQGRIILGLRPHHLDVAGPGIDSGWARLRGRRRGRRGARHRDAARGGDRRAAAACRRRPRRARRRARRRRAARRRGTRDADRGRRPAGAAGGPATAIELAIDPRGCTRSTRRPARRSPLNGAEASRSPRRSRPRDHPGARGPGPGAELGPEGYRLRSATARRRSRPRATRAGSTPRRRCGALGGPPATSRSSTARGSPGAARCSTSRGTSSASTRSSATSTCSPRTSSTCLHLHLSDDQGWRIAIDGWPRLTEVRRPRRRSAAAPAASTPRTTTGEIVALRGRAVRHRRARDRHARAHQRGPVRRTRS